MSNLPALVQRAPSIFYGAAVFYFVASVVIGHLQMGETVRAAGGSMDDYVRLGLLGAWLQAAEVAIYIAGNGVITHVLLAIWREGRETEDGNGE